MNKWQNFYLQRMGIANNNTPYPVCESVGTWGIYCKEIPFKLAEKVKEPAKRTWNDEHGDDEYISPTGLFMDAYTMKVGFGCKTDGNVNDVRTRVSLFLQYLRTAGMMKMYSSYTGIGRQNVRLSRIEDKAWYNDQEEEEVLVFEVEFKVNDPVTDITLSTSSSSD